MTKEYLEKLLNENFSLNQISKLTNKSLGSIRYWTKKYNLNSNHKTFSANDKLCDLHLKTDKKLCTRCNQELPLSEFYQKRGVAYGSFYCKKCTNTQTVERQQKRKMEWVEYKGGKCEKCGYDKYIGALEFHHNDPSKKDFTLAHVKLKTSDTKIQEELDKCTLLCSNCHREVHANIL
jgi:hypothetical protein